MIAYLKDKESLSLSFNEFFEKYGGFAFSQEQFKELKEKLNIKNNDELLSIGLGGYILKSMKDAFKTLNNQSKNKHDIIKNKMIKNYNYAFDAFLYELNNHEYGYTYETDDTIDALNLTYDDIEKHNNLKQALKDATKHIEKLDFT